MALGCLLAVEHMESNETPEACDCDYLRLLVPDICGAPRSKILTRLSVPGFRRDGALVYQGMIGFGSDGTVCERQLENPNCGNGLLKADWSTLYDSKTAATSDAKYKDVICSMYDKDSGKPYAPDTRHVTHRVLEHLDSLGLRSLSTFELEFWLLLPNGKPAWEGEEHSNAWIFSSIEPFLTDLDRSCASAGIKIQVMHAEYGSGQVEVNISPQEGIVSADHGFLFKLIAKEVARRHNFVASFMTNPLPCETASGWHLNLSVWSHDGHNIFYSDGHKPSQTGRHFLGGLVHHAAALCALCSPTVNCYRRLHKPMTPYISDIHVDGRFSTFRVQTATKEISRVENRIVSSACNPYLALAGTLAAGIDGIRRELEPDDAQQKKELPHTLAGALEALKEDSEMVKMLGEDVVRWFDVFKTDVDLAKLKDVNVKEDNPDDLAREFEVYKRM